MKRSHSEDPKVTDDARREAEVLMRRMQRVLQSLATDQIHQLYRRSDAFETVVRECLSQVTERKVSVLEILDTTAEFKGTQEHVTRMLDTAVSHQQKPEERLGDRNEEQNHQVGGEILHVRGRHDPPMTPEEAEAAYAQVPKGRDPDWGLVSTANFARHAGVSSSTVKKWIREGTVVAWKRGQRAYVLPSGQLDAAGRPIEGLREIVPAFGDGYLAWDWLTAPSAALKGKTPLKALAEGNDDEVTRLANAYLDGAFA